MALRFLSFLSLKFRFPRLFLRGCLILCWLIATLGTDLRADILHLKNGYYAEGAVEEVEEGYRVKTATGSVIYRTAQVLRWEKRALPADEYLLRKANTPLDDVDGNYVLGLWCKQHNFLAEARFHFLQVFRFDPNHKEARDASGYIYKNGEWITRSASMRQQGFLRYKGKWLPREEALALQEADRNEQERKEVFEKGWKRLRLARKLADPEDRADLAQELSALGPHVNMILLQGLNDSTTQIREVAIIALGTRPEKKCAEGLCRRMRHEAVPELQILLAQALRGHKQRSTIINRLVRSLLNTESRSRRSRLIYAMQVIKETNLIILLIQNTGYSPVEEIGGNTPAPPRKQIEIPDENAPGGFRLEAIKPQQNSDSKGTQPYQSYPAAEALKILTGMDYGNDTEAWLKWWGNNSNSFTFGEPKLP